ncbi:hypothetical protein [Streptomyces showdoensis]|uniref:Uncharacterized protein n=1 Tax=Streptomyces showdoensis TaxID=68268 RepID=A0A2P2GMP1_STREW|nr:hypothetical protein [Streptomyces showdoensis]KKZ72085.1 hypothetical protein VO63_20105 [Streptomyces showdoensis]
MAHPALLTLSVLAGVLAGYGAGTVYHRHRDRNRAAAVRLIHSSLDRDVASLRARLAARTTADDVLTEACDTVDAAYAHTRHSQEGGPTQ